MSDNTGLTPGNNPARLRPRRARLAKIAAGGSSPRCEELKLRGEASGAGMGGRGVTA